MGWWTVGKRFSLLEVIVAVGILVVAILSTMALLIRTQDLQSTTRETTLARAIVLQRVAELRATLREVTWTNDLEHAEQLQRVLDGIGTINSGTGSTAGSVAATDVSSQITGRDGDRGRLETIAIIKEDEAESQLGLNGIDLDGDATAGDSKIVLPIDGLKYLPIRVTVRWRSQSWRPDRDPTAGDRQYQQSALIY